MSKKTETIEIRVSPEMKERLSEVSKFQDQSMSQLIRSLISKEFSASAMNPQNAGEMNMRTTGQNRLSTITMSGVAMVALSIGWNLSMQSPVLAQPEIRVAFAEMDANDDGVISKQEFLAFETTGQVQVIEKDGFVDAVVRLEFEILKECEGAFNYVSSSFDKNLDSLLSQQEFSKIDINHDDRLEYEELRKFISMGYKEKFSVLDKNQNNYLEMDELESDFVVGEIEIFTACDKALEQSLEQSADTQFVIIDAPELKDEKAVKLIFAVLDENRDKRVSRKEFYNNWAQSSDMVFGIM